MFAKKVVDAMKEGKIIRLKPEDYDQCRNIWDMSKHPLTQKWYKELISGNRIIFVYQLDGEFAGEGALVFNTGDSHYTILNKRLYLSRLIVKENYCSQEIATVLLEYLILYAHQLGFSEVSVGVDCDNQEAWSLYKKMGFINVLFHGNDEQGGCQTVKKSLNIMQKGALLSSRPLFDGYVIDESELA